MGCIIDSCEYSDGLFLEKPICYSAKAIFIINLILLIKIMHQIFKYYKKNSKYFTRKLILFYLLLIEVFANSLYYGIQAWIQIYLIDIVQRHFVFVYLIYYFGQKLVKLMDPETFTFKSKVPVIFTLCSTTYFLGILIYGLTDSNNGNPSTSCKEDFWVYLRVGGLIMIFLFIILGLLLINRNRKANESTAEFTMIIKYSVEGNGNYNETEKSLIERNIENLLIKDENNYNLWLIMSVHFFSGVLSLTTTIYYAINSDSQSCGFYPFDKEMLNNETEIVLLGWSIYLINYFIPLIIIIKVFQFKEIKLSKRMPSMSEEEINPFHDKLKLKGHDPALMNDKSSPKSSKSSMISKGSMKIINYENSECKSYEEQNRKEEEKNEEEEKERREETRSSGFL